MATARKTAEKTAKAVQTINEASTALAQKFGLEIGELPDVRKYDTEIGRAIQLEYLGDVLQSIAAASKALKVEKTGNLPEIESSEVSIIEEVEQPKRRVRK